LEIDIQGPTVKDQTSLGAQAAVRRLEKSVFSLENRSAALFATADIGKLFRHDTGRITFKGLISPCSIRSSPVTESLPRREKRPAKALTALNTGKSSIFLF
jgi:hypothetical protein